MKVSLNMPDSTSRILLFTDVPAVPVAALRFYLLFTARYIQVRENIQVHKASLSSAFAEIRNFQKQNTIGVMFCIFNMNIFKAFG